MAIMISILSPVNAEEIYSTGVLPVTEEAHKQLENSGRLHIDEGTISSCALETSVDNSDTQYFPPIVSQGGYGIYTLYATTYYQMTYTIYLKY